MFKSIDVTSKANLSAEVLLKHSKGMELAIEATEETLWVRGMFLPKLLARVESNFIPLEFNACATKIESVGEKLPSCKGVKRDTWAENN